MHPTTPHTHIHPVHAGVPGIMTPKITITKVEPVEALTVSLNGDRPPDKAITICVFEVSSPMRVEKGRLLFVTTRHMLAC